MNINGISFRPAQESDINYLLQLRMETMTEHLVNSSMEVSEENHLSRILYQFESAKLIYVDGKEAGLLKVIEDEQKVEIIQIQISPAYQEKGIGESIIKPILNDALSKNLPVQLSVLKSNRAINFYKKLGFKVIGEDTNSFKLEYKAIKN